MKFIDILQDASGNMLRNKARTLLTIIAIFIGAMTLTLTNGIGSGISNYIDQQVGSIGADNVLLVQAQTENLLGGGPQKYNPEQNNSSLGSGFGPSIPMLTQEDITAIKSVSGITNVEPQIGASPDYVEGNNEERYKINTTPFISGTNLALKQGGLPNNQKERHEIILPPDYPAVLGFTSDEAAIGQQVTLAVTSATGEQSEVQAVVVGVQEETLATIGGASINKSLLNALYDLQTKGLPAESKNLYPVAIARISDGTIDTQLAAIKNELGSKGYRGTTVEDQIGAFKQVIDAIIMVLNVFAGIALLAASFGIVNTLLMSVQERTKEIGLMKAMGLNKNKIFLLFSIEAILLGFWGSLLGSLAGIGIGQIANRIATDTILKDLPGFNLTAFSPLSVAVIMLIIMSIAFVAGTVPARRASRKDPIEALRYE